jgi:amphi-Trp domain-containing protein
MSVNGGRALSSGATPWHPACSDLPHGDRRALRPERSVALEVFLPTSSMKSRKIKHADRRSVRACIEQLQAIVDGLRAGTIDMQQGSVDVHMRPGGMVEFELRLEQLARRETIKLEMNWRPEAVRVADPVDVEDDDSPISELPPPPEPPRASLRSSRAPASSARASNGSGYGPESNGSYAPESNGVSSVPASAADAEWQDIDAAELDGPQSAQVLDRIAAAEYQRLYTAARCLGSDGEWHLDKDQLIAGFARAGVDPLTQQELYSLAAQADADGRSIMFSEQAITALKVASQRHAALSSR